MSRKRCPGCCVRISAQISAPRTRSYPACRWSKCRHRRTGICWRSFLSGDGGWRDLDKTVGENYSRMAYRSLVGTACATFWSHKSPEQTARDLGAVIDTYTARWGTSKVALIGYSFGAGVLPFAYDRLSPEAKQRVVQLSLLGFETAADFEISLMGWLGAPPTKNALPTEPALAPIDPSMIQCFYGKDENDSLCPSLAAKHEVTVIRTGAVTISTATTTRSPSAFSMVSAAAPDERAETRRRLRRRRSSSGSEFPPMGLRLSPAKVLVKRRES